MPLIGIGGIDSGAAAIAKIEAGATLLQLYTGLVYEGPGLLARIKRELAALHRARKACRHCGGRRPPCRGMGREAARGCRRALRADQGQTCT